MALSAAEETVAKRLLLLWERLQRLSHNARYRCGSDFSCERALEESKSYGSRSRLKPLPRCFVRALRAGLLTAGLLTAASVAAEEAQEPDRVWYQLEVVLVERATVDTREHFPTDARPSWPGNVLALGPVWPEPVRPRSVGELFALWQDLDAMAGLRRVTPGLTPETEDLIRWLRDMVGSGSEPAIPWLTVLESDSRPETTDGIPQEGAAQGGAADDATSVADSSAAGDLPPEPPTDPAESPEEPQDVALESLALDGVELEFVEPPDPEDIAIPMALAFREVAPEQRLLRDEVRRLERAAGYRVLAHQAWRQPFRAEAPALPVRLEADDPETEGIDLAGNVGIALRRYLHARLELYRRAPVLEADLPAVPVGVDAIPREGAGMEPNAIGTEPDAAGFASPPPEITDRWIRIVHERRMRSGETHYLDHPRIAVLIRIEPFLLAEPLDEDGPVVRAVRD